MLPALIVLAPFPVGALPMPELCRQLTAATGVAHGVDGSLRDYPVFLSVHKADPKRVEALVAAALGGEWRLDGKSLKLVPTPPKKGEGRAEFERQFRLAAAGRSYLPALPLEGLYDLAPGRQVRFGLPSGPLFRPFAKGFKEEGRIMVRRDAYGSFSFREDFGERHTGVFTPGGQIAFKSLPPAVAAFLGADAEKAGLTAEQNAAVFNMVREPANLKIDWKALDKVDPVARMNEPILLPLVAKVGADMVVALPDYTMMSMPDASQGKTVGDALGAYGMCLEWRVVDGALVAALPEVERAAPAQTRRSVLSDFVTNARQGGIATPKTLSAYLAGQRPNASESWADMLLLVMSGTVVDEAYLGDHPYNLRFGDRFTPQDWAAVRSGKPFPATALSGPARTALTALLLNGRSRLESDKPDPATWPSLAPDRLVVQAELVEEAVVIGWTGFAASVDTPTSALANREMRMKELGREPLYQPALRRRLKLTISPLGGEASVETGFGEVIPTPGTKPVVWAELPESVRKSARTFGTGDVPPPTTVPPRR